MFDTKRVNCLVYNVYYWQNVRYKTRKERWILYMKNLTKRTIATIAAATMVMSSLAASINVCAETVSNTSVTSVDLTKIKYTDNTVDLRQGYNAATATITYNVSGDFAVASGGTLYFNFNGIDTDDFTENMVKSVKFTIKSGSTSSTVTITNDEKLAESDDSYIYDEDMGKYFTSDGVTYLELDINDLPEKLQTLYKTNKNLVAATTPTKTGMVWNNAGNWDIRKANNVDSIGVEIVLEKTTATTPTKKELDTIGEIFEDVTLNISGDLREYSVSNNTLYVAAKYDDDYADVELPADLQYKIANMKALGCYLDFDNYITDLADNTIGDRAIVFNNINDAITDYINSCMVLEAYFNSMLDLTDAGSPGDGNADNPNDYWYDSALMTETEALAEIARINTAGINGVKNVFNATPLDIRASANRAAFSDIVRLAKSGSTGPLNVVVADKAYPAVVKDDTYGYVDSSDYSLITNYSTLTTSLSNIGKAIAETKQLANVTIKNYTNLENTIKKSTISEARSYKVTGNTWTNLGALYTSQTGVPVLAQLNSIIGTNKGCKVIINVDPTTLPTTTVTNTPTGAFNTNVFTTGTAIGAARLRVNGAFALSYNDMANFDTKTNTYTFDWDSITNGKSLDATTAVWSLEFASYNDLGITAIVVSVPDQDAYKSATGIDKEETTDTNNTNQGGSLDVGEGKTDESDELEETIADEIIDYTPVTEDTTTNENIENTNSDVTDTSNTANTSDTNANTNTVTETVNPDTGTEDVTMFARITAYVGALAGVAVACMKRRNK